jgi:hypothetical protein
MDCRVRDHTANAVTPGTGFRYEVPRQEEFHYIKTYKNP